MIAKLLEMTIPAVSHGKEKEERNWAKIKSGSSTTTTRNPKILIDRARKEGNSSKDDENRRTAQREISLEKYDKEGKEKPVAEKPTSNIDGIGMRKEVRVRMT